MAVNIVATLHSRRAPEIWSLNAGTRKIIRCGQRVFLTSYISPAKPAEGELQWTSFKSPNYVVRQIEARMNPHAVSVNLETKRNRFFGCCSLFVSGVPSLGIVLQPSFSWRSLEGSQQLNGEM